MSIFQLKVKSGENTSPRFSLPLVVSVRDNKALTKNHASGKPNRIMAFFMPEICPATQTGHNDSVTPLTHFTGLNRHTHAHSVTNYGGVTLQNIKALWQICRAVACVTESEPRHPMTFHSVVLTQNTTQGGHTHA